MAKQLKFGNGEWYGADGSILAYNDLNDNYKPLPFNFERGSSATIVNKQGLIEVVGGNQPRVDYKDSEDGALLLEPQRTNSIPYSNEFTNVAWTKASAGTGVAPVVTENYGISPDGTLNADRLQLNKGLGNTTSDLSYIYETVASVGTGSISIWMKSNDGNNYNVALRVLNYTVVTVTNEWQRFELINQSSVNEIQLMLRGTYGTSDNADILIYGAQLEQGSYATSYIPTQGSASTRVAETASGSGNSGVFNSEQGILYAEGSLINDDGTPNNITLGDNTFSNNRMMLLFSNGIANRISARFDSSGSDVTLNADGYDLTLNHKVVLKYKENDIAIWVDGFEVNTGNSFSAPLLLNRIDFYNPFGGGQNNFYGKTKELAYYDTVLTDLELETLTSYRTWEAMVKELNLNIIHNE